MSRIEASVAGWVKSGCGCPVVATVQNWAPAIPGCVARPVVFIKYAGPGCEGLFYGEFDDYAQANRSAKAVNGWITRYFNKHTKAAA